MCEACDTPTLTKKGNGRYDLVVVGAGSAGFSAAITAAEQGAQADPLLGVKTLAALQPARIFRSGAVVAASVT